MAQFKVVITDREFETIQPELDVLGHIDAEVIDLRSRDPEVVMRATQDADGVIMQYAPLDERIIGNMRQCQVISKYAIGADLIDIDAATRKGICVANVPDYCTEEVSTFTVALILGKSRKIPQLDRLVRNGVWNCRLVSPVSSLRDCTVGLVGFGKIARDVLTKLTPFGPTVLVYDPYVEADEVARAGARRVELDELLQLSDVVSIHVPLLASTRHMFTRDQFCMMKRTAFLINMGRGPVIKEADLIVALREKSIAGAALDVTDPEPIRPDNPLLTMDNVIVTPHAAYNTEQSQFRLQTFAAESVLEVLSGYYPKRLYNKDIFGKVDLLPLPSASAPLHFRSPARKESHA